MEYPEETWDIRIRNDLMNFNTSFILPNLEELTF